MQYTVRGHDLSNVTSIDDLADKISQQGISSVQLALGMSFKDMPSEASNLNPGMGRMFSKTLAKKGIDIAILSCYINMIHPDLEIRETLLQKFESYVKNAPYFGAAMVASETGNVLPEIIYTEDNFTDEAFEELVSVIKRLVKVAETHRVMLGIEPGLNHPLYSIDRVEELLSRVPSDYLGIILDPTNLITYETYQHQVELVQSAFDRFGSKIVAIHLKDFLVEDQTIIPTDIGTGVIKFSEILDIVKQYKPFSFVVLEETKDDNIGKALKVLQK